MNIPYHKKRGLWVGALVGITGGSISMISNSILNSPLGYSPMGIKNFVKVGVIGGLSFVGVVMVKDTAEEVIVSIIHEVR